MTSWVRNGSELDGLASSLVRINVVGRETPALPDRFPPLREACDSAATYIAGLPHQHFLVLLSGGADSTLAAAALSRRIAEVGKEVTYAVTPSGFSDLDPRTVEWLLQVEGADMEWYDGDKLESYQRGLIVTGILGDELYGGWIGGEFEGLDEEVWGMTPTQLLARLTGLNESKALFDRFYPVFADMPNELTAANMLHWLAFKYTWDRERHVLAVSTSLGLPGVRYIHFFEHSSLQHWMMQDMRDRCGRTALDRKRAGIEVIRQYIGSEVVVPQKNKVMHEIVKGVPSLNDVLKIDTDGVVHRRTTSASQILC